jgi:hypothetical protein
MTDAMTKELKAGVEDRVLVHLKRDWETLRLITKSGAEYLVWTAPGGGCLALWNVLLMLINMQKCRKGG